MILGYTRAAVQYNQFLLNSKGTLTKEVICKDFVYLLQQSCSIEKIVSEYASDMVIDFIRNFPFVCFSPEVIKVCSYLLTVISQKIGREYDSKSKQVFNDQKVMLNTDQKILTQNIVFLMNCLLKLIFRGLYIDHNFVKVFCLHLIRQETSLLSELPFGYKFLKFLVNSFKVDKEAIETFKDQADRYNPYFWLVKEVEFDTRISSSDMSMFLSDKGLLRLQKINIEQRIPYASAQEILKLINYSIKNEIEFDFHAEDLLQINYVQVLKDIQKCCQELNILHFIHNNKSSVAQKLKERMQYSRNALFYIDIFEILCFNIGISFMFPKNRSSLVQFQFRFVTLIIYHQLQIFQFNFDVQYNYLFALFLYSYKLLIFCCSQELMQGIVIIRKQNQKQLEKCYNMLLNQRVQQFILGLRLRLKS